LIPIAQQQQSRLRRHSIQKLRHQRQIDHRGFVHDDHFKRKRISTIMTKHSCAWHEAQEPVQCESLLRMHATTSGIDFKYSLDCFTASFNRAAAFPVGAARAITQPRLARLGKQRPVF
jgi:hypothetical protein